MLKLKPWIDANYTGIKHVWHQDSALALKAKTMQVRCLENLTKFWPSSMFPLSSPACSPLDYGIWCTLKIKAYVKPQSSVMAMRASMEKKWTKMSEDYVWSDCSTFRLSLEHMIDANGDHFKK